MKLPSLNSPFVSPTGFLIAPWNFFLQSIFGPGEPIQPLTVGTSPFSFTANESGQLAIAGGTVSLIQIQRDITINTGMINGLIQLNQDDICIIIYSVAPTVNFIPS